MCRNNHKTMDKEVCEDLKAFERRLMEMLAQVRIVTRRWRIILFISSLFTCCSAFIWLTDEETFTHSLVHSLLIRHYLFTLNCLLLISLFVMFGVHRKIVAPAIYMSRARQVLSSFAMTCDDNGRLILWPRQNRQKNRR